MSYLRFVPRSHDVIVDIFNTSDNLYIGRLERVRVGQWMSWVLFLEPSCYLSASCQDEVREKTKELNIVKRKVIL